MESLELKNTMNTVKKFTRAQSRFEAAKESMLLKTEQINYSS